MKASMRGKKVRMSGKKRRYTGKKGNNMQEICRKDKGKMKKR